MARPWLTVLVAPTAQAFPLEVTAMASSEALAPGLGVDTCFHAVPFQRRATVLVGPSPLPLSPTAQAA